jgi:uncharacterized membrane protein
MLLAQQTADAFPRILIAALALIVVVILGFVLVSWVRNRLTSNESSATVGFTLSDLRRLHESGQMTDEEYERARAQIIAVAKSPRQKTDQLPGNSK